MSEHGLTSIFWLIVAIIFIGIFTMAYFTHDTYDGQVTLTKVELENITNGDQVILTFSNNDTDIIDYNRNTYKDLSYNIGAHAHIHKSKSLWWDWNIYYFEMDMIKHNVSIIDLIYENEGFWILSNSPVKVIFDDGTNFIFDGDSSYEFDVYSKFISVGSNRFDLYYSMTDDYDITFKDVKKI